jgi:hypothetical protein
LTTNTDPGTRPSSPVKKTSSNLATAQSPSPVKKTSSVAQPSPTKFLVEDVFASGKCDMSYLKCV